MSLKKLSLKEVLDGLNREDNFVFLETKRSTRQDYRSYIFKGPAKVISCNSHSRIKPSLSTIEKFLKKGYFAAGFLCYEAGFAFEEKLKNRMRSNIPLLWFGIYKRPDIINHRRARFTDSSSSSDYSLDGIKLSISEEEYIDDIETIKTYIERGDTYQVNYTFKVKFSFGGSITDLYLNLRRNQSVSYSALIKFGEKYIISLSPELFFRKDASRIGVKPMKGTAARGRFTEEDAENERLLHISAKNRSENIMIVDLLRNDIGRISETASVEVKKLFEVENYESLLQMTSTVTSRVKPCVGLYGLFKAIFPSGSVTGAPKIRTMQIIDELEREPRQIYTGSIGFLKPNNEGVFNVAIRTILLDAKSGRGEMGIGSGIVYDSDAKREYAECRLKARFLTDKNAPFQLIETFAWEGQRGYTFLGLHMERLAQSAAYFRFLYDEKRILKRLFRETRKFSKDKRYKVRLLLGEEGEASITSSVMGVDRSEKLTAFSCRRTSSSDIFLFHKSTNRNMYDIEYENCRAKGFYDVIFQNKRGQVTEGAISNIFIKRGGMYYTPPIACGLLNGICRRHILKTGALPAEEKVLYKEDIEAADEIIFTNAVRGMTKVNLVGVKDPAYA